MKGASDEAKASSMSTSIATQDGLRPLLRLSTFKDKILLTDILPPAGGTLSPNVRPPGFTPQFLASGEGAAEGGSPSVECVGSYLLVEKVASTGSAETYKALHIGTHEEFICKVRVAQCDAITRIILCVRLLV